MKRLGPAELFAFGLVGSVGFIVDAGILTLLAQKFGVNVYLSRLFSFPTATVITWLLNRSLVFNFRHQKTRSEYGKYLLVQTGGALVNLGVFALLLRAIPTLHATPVIPLAAGALFGLVFNYSGSRYWVFRERAED